VHDDGYLEYLFGNLGYLNKEMFIMRKIGRCEVSLKVNHDVINALKKNACWVQSANGMGDWWIKKENGND